MVLFPCCVVILFLAFCVFMSAVVKLIHTLLLLYASRDRYLSTMRLKIFQRGIIWELEIQLTNSLPLPTYKDVVYLPC